MSNLLFCLLFAFYQTSDYRIDLGKHYEIQKQERAQGYVEAFTIKDEAGKQQFIVSISKVRIPDEKSVPSVYAVKYKQAFLSRCGCNITSSEVVQFKYFEAQEFKMFRNGKGACIYSTVKGKNLYSITYSAIGNRNTEEKYPDFEKMINTLEFL